MKGAHGVRLTGPFFRLHRSLRAHLLPAKPSNVCKTQAGSALHPLAIRTYGPTLRLKAAANARALVGPDIATVRRVCGVRKPRWHGSCMRGARPISALRKPPHRLACPGTAAVTRAYRFRAGSGPFKARTWSHNLPAISKPPDCWPCFSLVSRRSEARWLQDFPSLQSQV